MALTTYAELQTAVASEIHRNDLTSVIPDFVKRAEAKLNRTLRVREMESKTTDTISSNTIALPADWLAFREIYIDGSPKQRLELWSPDQAAVEDEASTTKPWGYYIIGTKVYFFPTSDSTYTVGYTYYQEIPDLATNSTNWLLSAHPDLYLYASLVEAANYVQDAKLLNTYMTNYVRALNEIRDADAANRWSGGTMRMRIA